MMRIQRHKVPDPEMVAETYGMLLADLPDSIRWARLRPTNHGLLIADALRVARYGAVADPGSPEIASALLLAAEAGDCLFSAAAGLAGPDAGLTLGGEPIAYPEPPRPGDLQWNTWITCFLLNALFRREAAMDRMSRSLPPRRGVAGVREPRCRYRFIQALRSYHAAQPDTGRLILEAMDATDPETNDRIGSEYILHFDVHLINALGLAASDDGARFAEGLVLALKDHRAYWSRDEERRRAAQGFLAPELAGLAAQAWDRGLRFDVRSDYLPAGLITSPGTAS
jgi:hypothetical protein